ncbi:MAG TPA: WcaF family extracellular polysaccharide biosynthesis acetyltransferase [Puia sp.]|jgi:putative colanic acid biosynthesis acetyltransferase WcaF|nr:WcaF family extracellular polysaccharide biosynthesis acetyltransferase [Puia sp.]
MQTDLSKYSIGNYRAGPKFKVMTWYLFNYFIFFSGIPFPSGFKVMLLRIFGAKVGAGVVIKPKVRIKNPWRLIVGNYCWIGEDVWIDNIENVSIGNNVCLSQGAILLTGNHDYSKSNFPPKYDKIIIEDGVWICAKAIVCPGVICRSHSVLTVNSVATKDLEEMRIYTGNPAVFIRTRVIDA